MIGLAIIAYEQSMLFTYGKCMCVPRGGKKWRPERILRLLENAISSENTKKAEKYKQYDMMIVLKYTKNISTTKEVKRVW